MGTTTSNQDHGVTTTTSDHQAKTDGPSDTNWNPPTGAQMPHKNEVPTALATEHTSDKTKFGGGNVVRVGDAVGPNSGPAHPDNGAGGGIGSHTHLQEARVTEGSPNVVAEGKPIAREQDKTTQNHGNTNGQIHGSSPTTTLTSPAVDRKEACSLDTTIVKCCGATTTASVVAEKIGADEPAAHGRNPGPDNVLEIVTPDIITLHADRKNAKEASKGPECEHEGDHTTWKVSKWQSGKMLKEETFKGDDKTLDNSWFSWPGLPGIIANHGESKPIEQSTTTAKQAVRDMRQSAKDSNGTIRNVPNPHTPANTDGKSNNQIARETLANAQKQSQTRRDGLQVAANLGLSLYQFLQVWNAYNDPVEVKIEALACSGAKKYTIRSVMGDVAEFGVGGKDLEKIKAAIATFEKLCKIFQKLASLAGLPASFGIELCKLPNVKLEVQWKELKKDNPAIKKYKHHVDTSWRLVFEFEALVKWKGEFNVPLAWFLNFFAPGAGTALNTFINTFGLEANVGVDIDFQIIPAVWWKRSAGDTSPTLGGGVKFKLELYFRLKVKWSDWLEVSGGAIVSNSLYAEPAPLESLDLFQAGIKCEGSMKVGFRGAYRVDLWWWSKSDTFNYFPEQCKLSFPSFVVKPLGFLKA